MDCHMPEMDGFVTSRTIREWERQQGRPATPIIALTADIHPGIEEQCRAAGMDDYLSKPYSQETLARMLSHWLPADKMAGDTPGTQALKAAPAEERPLLDEARLESLRSLGQGRGSSLLEKAVRHYLEHTPAEIDRLRQAISDHDLESIHLIARNLKSSSSMLGAQRLAELFNSLEKKARQNHLEGAAAVMESIEELLPVVMEALQKAVSHSTGNETTGRTETVKGSGRVLLVDDDPNFRLVTSASLREAGFSVREAANGTEALKAIASDPPELVLLDALMEDIDGFEICSRIREMPETSQIPVLMVTGLDDTESVHKAFQAGAAGFITKQVNYPVLMHRIRFQIRVAQESIELHESQQQLAIAQHLAHLGHWRWEKASGKFIVSEQLAEICELTNPDRQDSLDDFLSLVHPDDREQVRYNIRSAMDRQVLKSLDYRIRSGSGKELFIHQELTVITPGTLLGTVQDITRQYESEQKIRKLAYSDELTGLASRSYFLRHLEDTINIASRHQERFSLLYLDLDSFKDINDTLGHDVGDELLKVVAKRLLKALRKSDFAARLGGDEFCILVDSLSINYAAEVASRCLEEVNRPVRLGSQTFNPRISIGIANYPGDGKDAQALLRAADSAMYAAKRAGKHRYAFYQPELTIRARKRLDMEHELRQALEEDQFELHYQPQVSLSTGRILGMEALVRWKHPRRGLVPPNEFIHVAERIGLIKRLGEWVLEAACTQARQWKDAGLPRIQMAVNISPLHFRDPVIVDQVGKILEKTGWSARDLELEVTEGVVQTEQDNLESFRHLKDLGVRIAIDDFGTGYSSLSSLKKLPIDCLKVDQLFVRDMVTDPESATLVGTIVALAKALGLEVVAEGVETEEETQILTALGCDLVQGYYFSRPVVASEIPALLQYDFNGLSNVVLH
ncbi:MAG: response regulator receiver protein, partial [Gammaproteobacteria bacterium]